MKIIIGGDLVPTNSNLDEFNSGNVDNLLGKDLLQIWKSADFRIFNLEVPLTNIKDPIDKNGPNLIAPTSTINGILKLEPSLISLANNHILDQGISGLNSTQECFEKNKIPYVGIGNNLADSYKPFIFERQGFKIGVYACTESEFTLASKEKPGANPFDPLESLDHIRELKNKCDYVIVLYHGGKEHYRYPSPYLQKVCRKMVEKGADIVICQHSHSIGCYEVYNQATIVYGQGNFIFDNSDSEFWKTSLLIQLEIDNFGINIDYIPFVKKQESIRLAIDKEATKILNDFENRSREIIEDGIIESKYEEFARKNIDAYLRSFSGTGKWMSRLDRKLFNGKILKNKYKKSQMLAIQNFIECEAHRELLISGIIQKRSEK
ncbi:CapA family protein [Bacillus sp. EB01]|uniref:CapA family protein n=1 Tax=Bacillus sp. EB01 TaxID=1347086 RepID=UPI0005C65759|nr:CapA family protein [Bacillus sp. EB01]